MDETCKDTIGEVLMVCGSNNISEDKDSWVLDSGSSGMFHQRQFFLFCAEGVVRLANGAACIVLG